MASKISHSARKFDGAGNQKREANPSLPPLRATLAAFGLGLGWGALNLPSHLGQPIVLVAWLLQTFAVAFIARAGIDLIGAALVATVQLGRRAVDSTRLR